MAYKTYGSVKTGSGTLPPGTIIPAKLINKRETAELLAAGAIEVDDGTGVEWDPNTETTEPVTETQPAVAETEPVPGAEFGASTPDDFGASTPDDFGAGSAPAEPTIDPNTETTEEPVTVETPTETVS